MTCIYALVDAETLEIRYIGKTTKSARERFEKHVNNARQGKSGYLYNWMRSLEFSPVVIPLEVDPADLNEAEKRWIALVQGLDGRLTNLTEGGDGASGLKRQGTFSVETREKMAAAKRGKSPSVEHRARIAAAHIGKPNPRSYGTPRPTCVEVMRQVGKANLGRSLTDEHKKAISEGVRRYYA